MGDPTYVRISELSRLAGVPVRKIRAYVKMGILPKPIKSARTVAYYTEIHLKRLKLIREVEAKKVSPALLRRIIHSIAGSRSVQPANESKSTQRTRDLTSHNGNDDPASVNIVQVLKDKMIESCIPIFRQKGYERTTIADICRAAGIGRNTFYLYFKDKKELLIECLNALFAEWKGEQSKRPPENLFEQVKKMFIAFHRVYPRWGDMMALFRASAVKYPNDFSERLERTITSRIQVISADVRAGIKAGQIREINPDLLAVMIAGVSELVCYYLYIGKFRDIEIDELADQMVDIWAHGIRKE